MRRVVSDPRRATGGLIFDLDALEWRPLRAAGGDFASIGSMALHRFGAESILISNAAWAPGDEPVRTVEVSCPQLPRLPRVFPPRFAWSLRPDRDGPVSAHGFASVMTPTDAGEQGGGFIELHPPTSRCSAAIVDSWIDRSPVAAFNRRTGRALTRRDLGKGFEYRLERGSDTIQRLPQFVRGTVPLALAGWEAPDEQHLVRAFMRALGAWREGRDPVARWWILMLAEDARLAYQEATIPQTSDWRPFSLGNALADAAQNPGHGGRIVRGVAWVLRLGAAALEVGAPNQDEWRAWIAAMVRYVHLVQLDNGAFYSAPYADPNGNPTWADQGEAWNLYGLDERYSECPSWQIPFLVRALWEAQVQVPELSRRVVTILGKTRKLWGTAPLVADMYGGVPGLPLYLVTAENGVPVPSVDAGVGPARSMYDADAFAVFVRAGLLLKLPAQYDSAGTPGITDDALRVAAEFGTDQGSFAFGDAGGVR